MLMHTTVAAPSAAVTSAGFRLDASGLAYLSNWVTPPGPPRRFDTRFFVVAVPADAAASPDPRRLFVYAGSHYNGEGYGVTARAVARRLLSDRRAGSAKPGAAAE